MATNSTGQECDVVVIGAGLAGLTAAYHLTKTIPGCKVLVLEAKDRVGGRTLTLEMKAANGVDSWDLGGQWVCDTQYHALWLIKELGMEQLLYSQYHTGKKMQQAGDNHKISSYEGDIPSWSVPVLLDYLRFEKKLDGLANAVKLEEPWKMPSADRYDSMTMETLLKESTFTKGARDVFETSFQLIFGSRTREQSALNGIFYIASGITTRHLYDNKDGAAQETKIKGGAQTLSSNLAAKIGQSNILLSEPVVSIDQTDTEKVKVQTLSGKEFQSKVVICAAPIQCTGSFRYLPSLPVKRQCLVENLHVGHLFKFIVTYKTTFWREKGFSGEIMSTTNRSSHPVRSVGPVQYVCDATTADGNPALVGFIADPLNWGQIPFKDRKAAILNHLADFIGPEAKDPVDFMEKDWSLEPYNGGCPVTMVTPGAADYWDVIRTPFGKIHWAGTETATHWNGYLSGAVQSGLRAAEEVANIMNPKRTISDVLESLNKQVSSHRKGGKN